MKTVYVKRAMNCSDWPEPAKWKFGTWEGELYVCICCPGCGHPATLHDHRIQDNGVVTPGVACHHCSFSADLVLELYELPFDHGQSKVH